MRAIARENPLLQGIIEERPRSKLAKSAKNKLKLTGHLDDD